MRHNATHSSKQCSWLDIHMILNILTTRIAKNSCCRRLSIEQDWCPWYKNTTPTIILCCRVVRDACCAMVFYLDPDPTHFVTFELISWRLHRSQKIPPPYVSAWLPYTCRFVQVVSYSNTIGKNNRHNTHWTWPQDWQRTCVMLPQNWVLELSRWYK